jgi:amino acid permease
MRGKVSVVSVLAGTVGVALLAVGITYLVVACEDLPGFLGPHPGDTSPRTPLGIVGVILGMVAVIVAVGAARRRPPSAPAQS